MNATVYIESSVVSYLTSQTSRDLVTAARQAITTEWWNDQRSKYDAYVSALVEEENSHGDPDAADRRLSAIKEIPALDISEQASALAKELIRLEAIPENSEEDALHIGIAASSGIDYLLTWNFKHLNNAEPKKPSP
ncbi:MAG: type II toxin-antitoxin system VapC family toxin [Sedimenticola sp.]